MIKVTYKQFLLLLFWFSETPLGEKHQVHYPNKIAKVAHGRGDVPTRDNNVRTMGGHKES